MSKKAEEFFNSMIGPGVSVFEIMEAYKCQEGDEKNKIFDTVAASEKFDALLKDLTPEEVDEFLEEDRSDIKSGPPIVTYPTLPVGVKIELKLNNAIGLPFEGGVYVQRLWPQTAAEDPLTGSERLILQLSDEIEANSWIPFNEDLESKFDGTEFLVCIAVPSGHAYEVAEWTEDEDFKRFATRHRDYCHKVIKYKHIN